MPGPQGAAMSAKLTPAMRRLLHQIRTGFRTYPLDGNERRTFERLERLGLVTNVGRHADLYRTTEQGDLADDLNQRKDHT